MEFLDKRTIKLDREIGELDQFVLDFVEILERHGNYVIVSGYVSILFGRARSTEDVDVFIEEIDEKKFSELYKELSKEYWCLNSEDEKEIYSYLEEGLAVRFAKKKETIPNFEVRFALKSKDKEALRDFISVITKKGKLKISSLERQIAFKKYYLKSDKDLEDARHIEKLFKEDLNYDVIEKYRKIIENEKA